ncbi:hypothetical protein BCR39DRAFT_49822 [Naematelia encephala]|uniref:Uncharacterized protein n=1 Tax=Naematelia encephala TaxID=71784 RepID=A0A1Y2AGY5_9TREE|nr:hypothetical protein BCR39DRAFT_49822 [Naematelia encephala]
MSFSTSTESYRAPFRDIPFEPEKDEKGCYTGCFRRACTMNVNLVGSTHSVEFNVVQTAIPEPLNLRNAYMTPFALAATTNEETQTKLDAQTTQSALQSSHTMSADHSRAKTTWTWKEKDVQLCANESPPRDMGLFQLTERGEARSEALSGGTSSNRHSSQLSSAPPIIRCSTAATSDGPGIVSMNRRLVKFDNGMQLQDLVNTTDFSSIAFSAKTHEPMNSREFLRTGETESRGWIEGKEYAMRIVVTQIARPVGRSLTSPKPLTLYAKFTALNPTEFYKSIQKTTQITMKTSTQDGILTGSWAPTDGLPLREGDSISLYSGRKAYGPYKVSEYWKVELCGGTQEQQAPTPILSSHAAPSGPRSSRI